MEQARAVLPSLKALEKKYDVLYMNTPWSKLDVGKIEKVPVPDLTSNDAAVFMWVDSHSVSKAMSMISKWGLQFHSVFQTADYATYPWMKNVKPKAEEPKKEEVKTVENPGETVCEEAKTSEDDTKTKTKVTRSKRVIRIPPVTLPPWWTPDVPEHSLASRPTTEQLWLLVKGDASKLFGTSTLTTHVVNMPEVGRRSKSKKSVAVNEWETERPRSFLDTVLSCLVDKNVKVLSLFASCTHGQVDCWGPNVPGGFLTSTSSGEGIVGQLSAVMKAMKKTQLQLLSSTMTKWDTLSDSEKDEAIKTMGDTWESMQKAMMSYGENGKVPYNWRMDSGMPETWMCKIVGSLASDHITNFSLNHQRKKKRKSTSSGDRPRYGIAKETDIPPVLADFLGIPHDEKMARTTVVSKINEYIAKNNLQKPEDRTLFILDDKLKTILTPKDGGNEVKYFHLSTLIGKHFPKKKKVVKTPSANVEVKQEVGEPSTKKMKVEG